jgi:hypothetical protein
MSRDRTLFQEEYIKPFTKYMLGNGWKLQPLTNEYEVLRFIKLDKTLEVVVFYKKKKASCITISGRTAELFTEFLSDYLTLGRG